MRTLNTAEINLEELSEVEKFYAYNGVDCMITFEVKEALSLKKEEAFFPYRMSRAMQGPAFTLMQRGIKIDEFKRIATVESLKRQKLRAENIFLRLCFEGLSIPTYYDKKQNKTFSINPASSQQLQHLFFEVLGLPAIKQFDRVTKEYKVSVDRKVLEKLLETPSAKPFASLILSLRDFSKKIQVLLTPLSGGRMRCSYAPAGTLTGRWSSSESVFGEGTNLQNQNDEMRQIFIPDEGLKFAQADLQQAESKLVAYLSLPWGHAYLDACNSGDLHTAVCKLIWPELPWGTEPDKSIAKRIFYRHFSYRDMAKRGGHLSNYAGTPFIAALHLNIPLEKAQEFQDKYFTAFPEIRNWQNSCKISLSKTRSIISPLGRKCYFPGRPWDNDTIKSAIAYAAQSTIGDALNLGFYRVWNKYDKIFSPSRPLEILSQVHDSILWQYKPENEKWLLPLILKELQVPIKINGQVCVVALDVATGWNWGKYSKSNLLGLKEWEGQDTREAPKHIPFMDRTFSSFHFPPK